MKNEKLLLELLLENRELKQKVAADEYKQLQNPSFATSEFREFIKRVPDTSLNRVRFLMDSLTIEAINAIDNTLSSTQVKVAFQLCFQDGDGKNFDVVNYIKIR